MLAKARERTGLTDRGGRRGPEAVEEYADMIQIGARNMQNTAFEARGVSVRPVLLKRAS